MEHIIDSSPFRSEALGTFMLLSTLCCLQALAFQLAVLVPSAPASLRAYAVNVVMTFPGNKRMAHFTLYHVSIFFKGMFLIERLGRRILTILSLLGCTASLIVLGVGFHLTR